MLTSASLRLTRTDSQSFLSSDPLLSPSLLHPSYHPFIPSISTPPSLSVISISVIALCLEVRSEALITTDDSALVCMPVSVCEATFSMSASYVHVLL